MLPLVINKALLAGGLIGGLGYGAVLLLRQKIQGYAFTRSNQHPLPSGRVALVTGANSGIGFETARELVRAGNTVWLACRSVASMEEAAAEIVRTVPERGVEERVRMLQVDMASFESVRQAAQKFMAESSRLDVLVNNAGLFSPTKQPTMTADGHELTWQVNYLSGFLLTELLLPVLRSSGTEQEPSRVVFTASGAHQRAALRFDDPSFQSEPEAFGQFAAYGQSKLAQIMEAQVQFDGEPHVVGFSFTPAACYTKIITKGFAGAAGRLLAPLIWLVLRTSLEGAQTALHCIAAPLAPAGTIDQPPDDPSMVIRGHYYSNCLPRTINGKDDIGRDQKACQRLYKQTKNELFK